MSTNWHQFREDEVGDDLCTRCEVRVTPEALMTFTAPCPAPSCPGKSNPDTGCVLVARDGKPCACLYCGREGTRVGEEVGEDIDTRRPNPLADQ